MAYCGKSKDVNKACDSIALNLKSEMYAVRLEALSATKDTVNPFLLTSLQVIDPSTGLYPATNSAYYPIKIEWLYNSALPTYEVVEGASVPDSYKQLIGPIVISDSESADGKANVKALNSNLWAIVAPMKGVADPDDTFHVFGITNGLKFLPTATAVEFGNRVVGNFASITGGEESTPNGVNWLDTSYANTLALFNNRLEDIAVGP
jgi:hypothetical protein